MYICRFVNWSCTVHTYEKCYDRLAGRKALNQHIFQRVAVSVTLRHELFFIFFSLFWGFLSIVLCAVRAVILNNNGRNLNRVFLLNPYVFIYFESLLSIAGCWADFIRIYILVEDGQGYSEHVYLARRPASKWITSTTYKRHQNKI